MSGFSIYYTIGLIYNCWAIYSPVFEIMMKEVVRRYSFMPMWFVFVWSFLSIIVAALVWPIPLVTGFIKSKDLF